MAAPGQVLELAVGQVVCHLAQPGIGAEEVLPDVGAGLGGISLVLAVDGGHHLLQQHAVDVGGEQLVPAGSPDHLDHVPARAPEVALQLLDDLAVAPHRAVEALEVAVHHPDEVAQLGPPGQRDGSQRLGLVALPVAHEAPHLGGAGVLDAAVVQVAVEAGVVDGVDRPQPHRHRGVLPEVGHQPGVGVAGKALAADLHAEVVKLFGGEAVFEEGPGVDAGGGVALDVDGVAGQPIFFALEEVVEPHLVQRGRRGEGGQVAADSIGPLVGPHHHDCGVPPDEGPDAALDVLVAGEERLVGSGDGVHIRCLHRARQARAQLVGPVEEPAQQISAPLPARGADHRVEAVEPLAGFFGVGVGQLV